eukprot:3024733-Pyramimonas_sp.AAC.1
MQDVACGALLLGEACCAYNARGYRSNTGVCIHKDKLGPPALAEVSERIPEVLLNIWGLLEMGGMSDHDNEL